MKSKKTADRIVANGGWKSNGDSIKSETVKGFDYYLYLELILILVSIVVILLNSLQDKPGLDTDNSIWVLVIPVVMQPYVIYQLMKTRGRKTKVKLKGCVNSKTRKSEPCENSLYTLY